MGLFRKLKEKWERWYYGDFAEEEEEWDGETLEEDRPAASRGERYFSDADTRTVFVLEALGQMRESAEKAELYRDEYDAVTSLITDMEGIDELSPDIRGEIAEQAGHIDKLEKERRQVYYSADRLEESRFQHLERYEDAIPDAIRKMREAEEYRRLIKIDLRRMEAEKASCRYQLREAVLTVSNSRGVAIICAVAMLFAIALLAVMQYFYRLDVSWGYLLICGAGAIALTVLFVRYQEASREIKKLEKLRDKIISLHNTVKIRYVNNTNLLSYLYMKYDVESSEELEDDWAGYMEEVNARQKDEKLREDLEYYYNKLTATLRSCGVTDPEIWTRQAKALVDHSEMLELRHALIARRGKLREHLEYNRQVAERSKQKIKDLAMAYPQYAKEIAGIVERYEGTLQDE
ncbi:MAG: hypothetical protein K6E50_02330 [Lachnospiraceae bacterium]|nr:hypothetical protein [Lachnospiraceae bacterium]